MSSKHEALALADFALARQTHLGSSRERLDEGERQAWDNYDAMAMQLQRIPALENALLTAIWRLEDMLKGDDGQAWKEAEKALPGLRRALGELAGGCAGGEVSEILALLGQIRDALGHPDNVAMVDRVAALLAATQPDAVPDHFPGAGKMIGAPASEPLQSRVHPWLMACFGPMIAGDREERNHRFLEEALELVQSCDCTAHEAHQLVDYVFGRPVGEKNQEVGGVMITLAALCLANGLDMHAAGETELARIWTMVEKIRAKQAAKPKYSPLPEEPAAPALVLDQEAPPPREWITEDRSYELRSHQIIAFNTCAGDLDDKLDAAHKVQFGISAKGGAG